MIGKLCDLKSCKKRDFRPGKNSKNQNQLFLNKIEWNSNNGIAVMKMSSFDYHTQKKLPIYTLFTTKTKHFF